MFRCPVCSWEVLKHCIIGTKKGLRVFALHAAPVLWVILKGDSNNLFQMSVCNLRELAAAAVTSTVLMQPKKHQSGVDKQKPGVLWGSASEFALLKLLQLKVGVLEGWLVWCRLLVLGIEPKPTGKDSPID